MTTERQEELQILIERTRDKLVETSKDIQRMNYSNSFTDQSWLKDVIKYVDRLKMYQSELSATNPLKP
jgi:hypothetical protein